MSNFEKKMKKTIGVCSSVTCDSKKDTITVKIFDTVYNFHVNKNLKEVGRKHSN